MFRLPLQASSGWVLCFGGFFNLHVAELLGVKDLATIQALDKLAVFVPGDDSYPWDVCRRLAIARGIGEKSLSFRKIVAAFAIFETDIC
jgi:hypothetical protein